MKYLDAKPRDINDALGTDDDHRTLDKLINGNNLTCDDRNMWLTSFIRGKPHYVYINFPEEQNISAIKIFNYNKSDDETSKGIKVMTISADGKLITSKTGNFAGSKPNAHSLSLRRSHSSSSTWHR